jgi:hypothetical protein
VRWAYDGEPVGSLVYIWVCFDRCASTVTPTCLRKISPSKGRASRDREMGGGVTSPSSCSSSSCEDSGLKRVSSPHTLTAIRVAL